MFALAISRTFIVFSLLGLIAGLSFYGTWGRYSAFGAVDALSVAASNPDYLYPGTTTPLLRTFTGIAAIDTTLTVLILVFAPTVDGRSATLSLYSAYFAGQIFPVSVAIYADSYRRKNLGKWWLSPTPWWMLAQLVAMANSAPWLVALYVLTNSTENAADVAELGEINIADPLAIVLLPLSHLLGHILPCYMAARRANTWEMAQRWILIWQFFPILVSVSQTILMTLFQGTSFVSATKSPSQPRRFLGAIRFAYGFSIFIATVAHIATMTLAFCAVYFPDIFAPGYADSFHPSRVFVLHTYSAQSPELTEVITGFLQWDQVCAFAAMLVWAADSFLRDYKTVGGEPRSVIMLAARMGLGYIALGPGAIVLLVQWAGEEVVFGSKD